MRPSQARWLLVASLAAAACGETRAAVDPSPPAPLFASASPRPAPPSRAEPAVPAASSPPVARVNVACPGGMARIEGFCIDRYEAHLIVRGQGIRHLHHARPDEGVEYEARSEAGVFPQAYMSRIESMAACANAGKRLCTMVEWQRACRGSRGATYPYGDHLEPKRCNMDKPHLITILFGPDPRRWTYQHFNNPALAVEPGFLARAGSYGTCAAEDGVYDLVGNLHEWVSDTADAALMGRLATEGISRQYQPWRTGNGVFMGGFFSTHEEHGPGCRFTTVAHEPAYHDYSTGFRCCADAPDHGPTG